MCVDPPNPKPACSSVANHASALRRIHVPAPPTPGQAFALPPDAAHHLRQVLRAAVGAPLTLFTGDGREWPSNIVAIDARHVMAQAETSVAVDRESPLPITLTQAIGKGQRMEHSIQKAVELGVSRIVPVFTQRSVVKLDAQRRERKTEHWRAVAVAACEQCGRNRIPEIAAPEKLMRYFATRPLQPMELGLFLDPRGDRSLTRLTRPARIRVLIGPEGGFTAEERAQAAACGYLGLRLGARILRTETAGPAIIAALQTLWGDFG